MFVVVKLWVMARFAVPIFFNAHGSHRLFPSASHPALVPPVRRAVPTANIRVFPNERNASM